MPLSEQPYSIWIAQASYLTNTMSRDALASKVDRSVASHSTTNGLEVILPVSQRFSPTAVSFSITLSNRL
jgi:hypothetical protein